MADPLGALVGVLGSMFGPRRTPFDDLRRDLEILELAQRTGMKRERLEIKVLADIEKLYPPAAGTIAYDAWLERRREEPDLGFALSGLLLFAGLTAGAYVWLGGWWFLLPGFVAFGACIQVCEELAKLGRSVRRDRGPGKIDPGA